MMNLRRSKLPTSAIVAIAVAGLAIAAAAASVWYRMDAAEDVKPATKPAKVEAIAGTPVKRVTLTPDAAKRLDVQTVAVREEKVGGIPRKVIPYAAVIYDRSGETWTITSPEQLVFVRQKIAIDRIDNDTVVLTDGPPVGTTVVTVGAAEIYGSELGVG